MAFNLDVSFFILFKDLDPSAQKRCIFFTLKGARCGWDCKDKDNQRAIELQYSFRKMRVEAIDIEMLTEYAQCNCCLSGRARHQDLIEDLELLTPLAQRWLDEIRVQEAECLNNAKNESFIRDRPSDSIVSDSTEKPPMSRASTIYNRRLSTSPNTCSAKNSGTENRSHYELRTRRTISSGNITHLQPLATTQRALSEFRRHIVEASPSDSVYQKMLDPLKDRDFETGALYIFDRESY